MNMPTFTFRCATWVPVVIASTHGIGGAFQLITKVTRYTAYCTHFCFFSISALIFWRFFAISWSPPVTCRALNFYEINFRIYGAAVINFCVAVLVNL